MKLKIIITIQATIILFLAGYTFYQSDWYRDWVAVDLNADSISIVYVQADRPTVVNFLEFETYAPEVTCDVPGVMYIKMFSEAPKVTTLPALWERQKIGLGKYIRRE